MAALTHWERCSQGRRVVCGPMVVLQQSSGGRCAFRVRVIAGFLTWMCRVNIKFESNDDTARLRTTGPKARRCISAASALTVGLLAAMPSLAQTVDASDTHADYVRGRILVMPRAGLPSMALEKVLAEHGGGRARRIGTSELHIVELPAGAEQAMVERLARHPHIKFAERDQLTRPNASVSDPFAGSQWHLGKIGAFDAWNLSQGSGVTIAILDTGVDASHPDLVSRLVPGWNFFNNSADTSDAYNHGTKVAGSAAAAMNNSIGVAGVSGQAKIMPIRISDATGYGSWSAMAQGLTYAADRGVRVANISYSSAATSASVLSAAQYMKNKGGLVFVSAGNTGAVSATAQTTSAIVVGATDASDLRSSFSTFGPVVRLAAPGSSIYSTTNGGGYAPVSGTSFSSPVAAGVAALVMAANPSLSSAQVEGILFSTAVDLGSAGRDDYFGNGRVNATAAVQAAMSSKIIAPTDTQTPIATLVSPSASSTVTGLVPVNVSVSDNVGVVKVEFRVNGKTIATDTVSPFAFSWDTASVANGMNGLSIVAYDAAGNSGASASVAVNVANSVALDTQAPTVAISNPANGSTVAGSVIVLATAADNAGSAAIELSLFINDKAVAAATGAGLSYRWNTRKLAAGAYALRVVARDASGNTAVTTSTVRR